MGKQCNHCKKEFQPNHGKQIFCSTNCRVASSRSKKEISGNSIKPKEADKFFQKGWVPLIEKYCLEEAGIDPEALIEQHRSFKKKIAELSKAIPKVQVIDLTNNPPKTNFTINTEPAKASLSKWAEEYRRKKTGIQ